MIRPLRSSLVVALLTSAELLFAQTSKGGGGDSYWETLSVISATWWICTLIGTALFGLLIGFFVYRNAVANGRASSATGAGCLISVAVFLIAQVVALTILVFTVYANYHPTDKDKKAVDEAKHAATSGTTSGAAAGSTDNSDTTAASASTGTTSGDQKTPAKPTTTTGSTSGDDF